MPNDASIQATHPVVPEPTEKPQQVINAEGDLVGAGLTGIVERTPAGLVIKTPWPGDRADECRRDMATEARIYQRLGEHPRLVRMLNWDPVDCTLTLEDMVHGSLRAHLDANNAHISRDQRLAWVSEAAEAVQLLHDADIVHCDVGPNNFLVGKDLGLRIADFSGSSVEGSKASACPGSRFTRPDFDWRAPPQFEDDVFSLGSTIYTILTGKAPFHELGSDEVESRFAARTFPDTSDQIYGHIIEGCWTASIASAQEVLELLSADAAGLQGSAATGIETTSAT